MKTLLFWLLCTTVLLWGCSSGNSWFEDYERLSNEAVQYCFDKWALRVSHHCATYSWWFCNTSNVYFECYDSSEQYWWNMIYSWIRTDNTPTSVRK